MEHIDWAKQVHTDMGTLLLPTYDRVIGPWMEEYGSWEREESLLLTSLLTAGMTVLDIGAHVGYHTLSCANRVGPTGHVFAFEPEPHNFQLLSMNLERAGASNVNPFPFAVWRTSGVVTLSTSPENSGDHRTFGRTQGSIHEIEVECVALDEFFASDVKIDFAKIDVQGADHIAVQGMEGLIARSATTLLVEIWPAGIREGGEDPSEVVNYYRDLGYGISIVGETETFDNSPPDALIEAVERSDGGFGTLLLTPEMGQRRGKTTH